ncbi:MAG: hypothetical protein LBI62_01595 [Candidatus Accumulibacter sp.]|nr:hypothetical protein [Accumulibacter sp.]
MSKQSLRDIRRIFRDERRRHPGSGIRCQGSDVRSQMSGIRCQETEKTRGAELLSPESSLRAK